MVFLFRQRAFIKLFREVPDFTKYNNNNNVTRCFSSVFLTLKPKPKTLKSIYLGVGVGGLTGAAYSTYKNLQPRELPQAVGYIESQMLKTFPNVTISRQVLIPGDASGLKLTLFQYPTCPFCCKVRAFLDYYGISYNIVEVNPVLRQQIKWSEYKKVPILLTEIEGGYQQLCDSSMIMSALATYLRDKSVPISNIVQSYPIIKYKEDGKSISETTNRYSVMNQSAVTDEETRQLLDERHWRMWADNSLVHTLSPNVYRTTAEALQAFHWFAEVGDWKKLFPSWETSLMIYVGAYAMWMISKKLKKKHHLKDNVRQSLYDDCNKWMKEIKRRKSKFFGGVNPNLADLSVYGVLSSIEGCTAFKDLLDNTKIGTWYFEMKNEVQKHGGM